MSLNIYKITGKEIIPTEEIELENDKIYIIVDKQAKRTKIWIWSGPNTSKMEKYFAGVTATKIKSSQKLYGASIEVVESGNEPKNFPILSKDANIKKLRSSKAVSFEEEIGEQLKVIEELKIIDAQNTIPIEVREESITDQKSQKELTVDIEKLKVFLKDITENLKRITNKIETFLEKI